MDSRNCEYKENKVRIKNSPDGKHIQLLKGSPYIYLTIHSKYMFTVNPISTADTTDEICIMCQYVSCICTSLRNASIVGAVSVRKGL